MSIGPLEIIIVIVILLLLFGARRLPELGSGLGKGIRGFGRGVSGDADDDDEPSEEQRKVEAAAPKPPPVAERPAEKAPPRAEP
jgi:sec-independent protein translocase protein TatA